MEELLEILQEIKPGIDFTSCTNLIEDGYLTSFDIVMLISEISQQLEIEITANEILPENFTTVDSIYQMLQRLEED